MSGKEIAGFVLVMAGMAACGAAELGVLAGHTANPYVAAPLWVGAVALVVVALFLLIVLLDEVGL